ncbi:MAG: glutamate 5-kinase, partial [Coprobacillaceae bacterium]
MRNLEHIKNVIVKIGSSSLCSDNGKIHKEKVLNLIQQVAKLHRNGLKVTIVSSGAIAAGMGVLDLDVKPSTIPKKQALAAIGQASLMQIYEDIFHIFDLQCAQILVNHGDFDDRKRLLNLQNAMQEIINYKIVPIINENDALAVDEIKVGDNDTLAALIAPVVNADLLVLVSDIDGLYDDNPHINKEANLISQVDGIQEEIRAMAKDTSSKVGTGGMATKIKAAQMVNDFGCDMAIVNGSTPNVVLDLLAGKEVGTYFTSTKVLSARNHWLLYRSLPKGKIIVDDGASHILISKHTSLLPSGILDIDGNFMMSQVVEIVNLQGTVIARGISNYSSDELRLI